MTSLSLSTTNSVTNKVMRAAMKSSRKESQRDPEWKSVKWLELMSFSVLNLQPDRDRKYASLKI